MDDWKHREKHVKTTIEVLVKAGAVGILLIVSFFIVKPFLTVLVWAVIIAVAIYPVIHRLTQQVGGRKRAVGILAIAFSAALIVPGYILSGKIIESSDSLEQIVRDGKLTLSPPPEKVKEWPVIGHKTYQLWKSASLNLESTLEPFEEQIKKTAKVSLSVVGNLLSMVLLSFVSIFVAIYLIFNKEQYVEIYKDIARRLIGDKGNEWADLSVLIIRSVATGVIGVAVIQASAALVGLVMMDVPFSLLIATSIMFLNIIQLPTLILIGPVIVYVFSYAPTTTAIIFAVYMLIVTLSDSVLKSLLMGRGVDIPILVILIGAIGGMILMGMIGLFIGAVVFSLSYKLFKLWISDLEHDL